MSRRAGVRGHHDVGDPSPSLSYFTHYGIAHCAASASDDVPRCVHAAATAEFRILPRTQPPSSAGSHNNDMHDICPRPLHIDPAPSSTPAPSGNRLPHLTAKACGGNGDGQSESLGDTQKSPCGV